MTKEATQRMHMAGLLVILIGRLSIWLGHGGHSFGCSAERLGFEGSQGDSCDVDDAEHDMDKPRRGGSEATWFGEVDAREETTKTKPEDRGDRDGTGEEGNGRGGDVNGNNDAG